MALNGTDFCNLDSYFGAHIGYGIVFINSVAILECLTVILIIWRTKKLHGTTNIFVASLAANDIIFALSFIGLQIPFRQTSILTTGTLTLLMLLVYGMLAGSTTSSILHMTAIAIDRYIHIAYPFYYLKKFTNRLTFLTLFVLWSVCFLGAVIPPVAFHDSYYGVCILLHQPVVFYCIFVVMYLFTLLAIFICYMKIAYVAFKHKKAANARRLQATDIELRNNRAAAIRSVKYFAVMVGVFVACTIPLTLCTGLTFFYIVPNNAYIAFFFLNPGHSVINFIIYATSNKDFFAALKKAVPQVNIHFCRRE